MARHLGLKGSLKTEFVIFPPATWIHLHLKVLSIRPVLDALCSVDKNKRVGMMEQTMVLWSWSLRQEERISRFPESFSSPCTVDSQHLV